MTRRILSPKNAIAAGAVVLSFTMFVLLPAASSAPADGGGVALSVRAVPGDGIVDIGWTLDGSGIQVASQEVSRDGFDSTGHGPWSSGSIEADVRTWTFDKLVLESAPYTFTVAVTLSDGSTLQATAAAIPATPGGGSTTTAPPTTGPTTTAPATTAPPTTALPTTAPSTTGSSTTSPTTDPPGGDNLSGLPWSSGVWGTNRGSGVTAFEVGPRAGARADNILVYTSRQTQAAQNNPGSWRSGLPADFDPERQDLVLAVTSQTEDNAGMTASQARELGSSVCSIDADAVVRLDWEMNLPDGTANGAELNAGNFDAWVARFETVAVGMKATCPGIRIDFNPNHGADQTSGCGGADPARWCSRRAFQQLKDHVTFFGIDTYDSYPPVTSESGWDHRLTRPGELDESRRYALANGKLFTVPEWGVACNGGGCQWAGNAGGDNPMYIERYLDYFAQHAADIGYETYFNEPASYIVSDLVVANPAARAAMRAGIREHSTAV